jgi:probable F420-dependent oxidoreductase
MQIGLAVAQIGAFADADATRTVAREAEAAGFTSLWALDRLLAPTAPRSPYPASDDGALPTEQLVAFDPIVTLAVAAAVTERIRIGTDVLVAPWYPPALLARSLATLDQLSDGRLTVGLGLGWSVDEYEAVGAPMSARGVRLEEILEVVTMLWRPGEAEIETSRERIAPATMGVAPRQAPRPPILLAAYTSAGLERIARRADGWLPTGVPLDHLGPMWTTVRRTAERYGRDPGSLRLVLRANPKITATPLGADRQDFAGTRKQVADDIERARGLGVDELILDLQAAAADVDDLLDTALELAGDSVAVRVA